MFGIAPLLLLALLSIATVEGFLTASIRPFRTMSCRDETRLGTFFPLLYGLHDCMHQSDTVQMIGMLLWRGIFLSCDSEKVSIRDIVWTSLPPNCCMSSCKAIGGCSLCSPHVDGLPSNLLFWSINASSIYSSSWVPLPLLLHRSIPLLPFFSRRIETACPTDYSRTPISNCNISIALSHPPTSSFLSS